MSRVISLVLLALVLLVASCSSGSSVAKVGEPAPDFQLQDLDDQTVSLSDFRGKTVLLNFWGTWCIPCRDEMPYLQELHDEKAGNPSLVILTINLGEGHSTVKEFMDLHHLSLPVLFDTDGVVGVGYNIQYVPTTFFIDKDGIVQGKVVGAFPSKAAIEGRLAKLMP